MGRPDIVAYMSSGSYRRVVRDETLADLRATDWDADVVVVVDQARAPGQPKVRATDNARETLEHAAQCDRGDLILFLEDDLAFNRHLRHNLLHWPPIAGLGPDDHFCGSLYDPDVGSLDPALDGDTWRIADPALPYGSQAVLLARPTVHWILDHWRAQRGLGDLRIFRLAAAVAPIHYHRPSLVQHRPVASGWGGVAHRTESFDPTFRATPLGTGANGAP